MATQNKDGIFEALGLSASLKGASAGDEWFASSGDFIEVKSPTTGELLAKIEQASESDYEKVASAAAKAFETWRAVPTPKRGEVVRLLGAALREKKEMLGRLVSLEMGKILTEGLGEVQEMIDICDYAVGLSRTLSGPTLQSERPMHRMMEQWHPLGPIGVITAFNFPVAVWAWNSALAFVCGDPVIWKPSSKTPLCAVACQNIARDVLRAAGVPAAVSTVIIGRGSGVGERIVEDPRLALISATGSTKLGRHIGEVVGKRLGRTILELGGNNALIISDKADLRGALASAFFGAVGTAGQRCTSTRRLIIHQSIYAAFLDKLVTNYQKVAIGDPLDPKTLMGPLIDESAVRDYEKALEAAKSQGGKVVYGGQVLEPPFGRRTFVKPTIVEIDNGASIVQTETFAPILYVMKYETIEQAITLQNAVPQGLSSGIFTDSMAEAERFLSFKGSDCGIANVNVGTSGAEIGGAFGGEKETGGGRESGSDSWKQYMRRQTNTINWGGEVHLAQGVDFSA
ncbi:MAG: aldehyde dehydrogenase family protein [Polyangiaceae bacterium]|nr:aldehyde dehydrogenase family protein [Polyangiaceae bacterium]MCE7891435.1 aldehyde dehydrogenase family protein [Sorangiineae bacterium PRO1]MCL4751572.1 aldehyde dehydrogenase family protein [Myxococcales bacterium]